MSRIQVDTAYISDCSRRINAVIERLYSIPGRLESNGGCVNRFRLYGSVRLGYVGSGVTHSTVRSTLAAYRRVLVQCANKASQLGIQIERAGAILQAAEDSLMARNGNAEADDPQPIRAIAFINPAMFFTTTFNFAEWAHIFDNDPAISTDARFFEKAKKKLLNMVISGATLDDVIDDIKKDANNWIVQMTSISGGDGIEDSLYHIGEETDNAYYNVDVGEYHAEYSYNAGLTRIDENGNLVVDPKLNFAAGIGFTAFTATAGLHGELAPGVSGTVNADVIAGRVDANCNASMRVVDENGRFNPHAKASVNIEAIALEATVDGSVSALGVTTTGEVGVNIGIGAHGNVEIGDGVISADIGLSFGLGIDAKITIDYGQAVDAVVNGCESAINFISSGMEGAANAIGDAASNAVDFFGSIFSGW